LSERQPDAPRVPQPPYDGVDVEGLRIEPTIVAELHDNDMWANVPDTVLHGVDAARDVLRPAPVDPPSNLPALSRIHGSSIPYQRTD